MIICLVGCFVRLSDWSVGFSVCIVCFGFVIFVRLSPHSCACVSRLCVRCACLFVWLFGCLCAGVVGLVVVVCVCVWS